jgi:hypothetical protein
VRPKIRFEVFKRDGFTCAYCNRKTPDVVLEVDHIIPRAEGGDDELENLVTACWDCNRGKGATLLDSRAPVLDIETQTDLINEKERQIKAYGEAKREQRERRNAEFEEVWNYWFAIWNVETVERWKTPHENALRRWIERLGTAEVMDAMDATRTKFNWLNSNPVRYLAGICKWKILEQENRVALCTLCGKRLELEAGDDPGAGWYHVECKEASG